MLFSGATAATSGIVAEPTWQNIYVDGEQVSVMADNIAGNNYVKLRDIGKEIGFNVYWLDGVEIDMDAPHTDVAPAQKAEDLPTIKEIRQEMILRINEVHRENGIAELTVNQSLMDAAQKCSTMLNTFYKSKEECLTVIDCGYPHGFNCNLTAFTGVGIHRIAEKAVTNWVNSPGHFQTMIGRRFKSGHQLQCVADNVCSALFVFGRIEKPAQRSNPLCRLFCMDVSLDEIIP